MFPWPWALVIGVHWWEALLGCAYGAFPLGNGRATNICLPLNFLSHHLYPHTTLSS